MKANSSALSHSKSGTHTPFPRDRCHRDLPPACTTWLPARLPLQHGGSVVGIRVGTPWHPLQSKSHHPALLGIPWECCLLHPQGGVQPILSQACQGRRVWDTCRAWLAGAILGRCRLVSSPDTAAICLQCQACSIPAQATSISPARPHTTLCSFPPPLLFFPEGCEKVQSACDRFSSLPSPFLLVKTAILEQPCGLVKGYL